MLSFYRTDASPDLCNKAHIEANATDALEETSQLERMLNESGEHFPLALLPFVDLSSPQAADQLARQLAASTRVRGVRQILNVHADPQFDYVGRHYLREVQWQCGMALLERHGLIFELQIYPSQMQEAAALAKRYPAVRFALNHAGMYVDRHAPAGWRAWRDGMRALAACSNVHVKLSGFGMLDHHWTEDSLRPLVYEAIDAFGSARCMFASNFPVCSLYTSYRWLWQAYDNLLAQAAAHERRAMFADNAWQFYQLGD